MKIIPVPMASIPALGSVSVPVDPVILQAAAPFAGWLMGGGFGVATVGGPFRIDFRDAMANVIYSAIVSGGSGFVSTIGSYGAFPVPQMSLIGNPCSEALFTNTHTTVASDPWLFYWVLG